MKDRRALSPAEKQVLELLLEHCTNAQIAEITGKSINTVNSQRNSINVKTGMSMREHYLASKGQL